MMGSALGKDMTEDDCKVLVSVMGLRQYQDGDILVREGEADNTLFILVDGKITVNSKINGIDTTVYTMKVGECAGTRAFVDMATRQATLRAVGDTTVYTLKPQDFETLLTKHPRVVYKFMRGLFRLTHSNLMRMNAESQQLSNYIQKSRGRY
jgi:CRP-like cAMP-binding protein